MHASALPEDLRLQLVSSLGSVRQECGMQRERVERVLPELEEVVARIREQSKAREEDGAHLNRLSMRRMPLRSKRVHAPTAHQAQFHGISCLSPFFWPSHNQPVQRFAPAAPSHVPASPPPLMDAPGPSDPAPFSVPQPLLVPHCCVAGSKSSGQCGPPKNTGGEEDSSAQAQALALSKFQEVTEFATALWFGSPGDLEAAAEKLLEVGLSNF